MAYQVTHPTEVGCFGRFRHGGNGVVETWEALEDLCIEYCGGMWIGIYSAYDVIRWARDDAKVITIGEYEKWFDMLQDSSAFKRKQR
jgi:hypothetical protein